MLSPLLGGGIAGFLRSGTPRRGARARAISGALATASLRFVLVSGLVSVTVSGSGMVPGEVELVIVIPIMLPILALWFVELSVVSGYVGTYLQTESSPVSRDSPVPR
ncbi:DUF5518 domain-containing protein [Natronorarus salvus]|uniref:DUF5518 domain-containing protein n=1 Tax=Natronorarus salvus TaxID=3117733 RepID=UPI0039080434